MEPTLADVGRFPETGIAIEVARFLGGVRFVDIHLRCMAKIAEVALAQNLIAVAVEDDYLGFDLLTAAKEVFDLGFEPGGIQLIAEAAGLEAGAEVAIFFAQLYQASREFTHGELMTIKPFHKFVVDGQFDPVVKKYAGVESLLKLVHEQGYVVP